MERRGGSGEVSQEVASGAVFECPGRWEAAKLSHTRHGGSPPYRKSQVGLDAWEVRVYIGFEPEPRMEIPDEEHQGYLSILASCAPWRAIRVCGFSE